MNPLLIDTVGRPDLALIHLLQLRPDPRYLVETVDALDPRYPRGEKSVIICSTQYGCPVGCLLCDAGGVHHGNLTAEEILAQVLFVLGRRPELLGTRKLKVHFARMGEPALNPAVLEALARLPDILPCPGLLPCITTVAPAGSQAFFRELLRLKRHLYPPGAFQLQLSINSTDPTVRRRLIPCALLDLEELAALTAPFVEPGDRRVVLNFALARSCPVEAAALRRTFDPATFMVKLTPVNPTRRAEASGLQTVLSAAEPGAAALLVATLESAGFETVVSIGDPEEIAIGSNCGQAVRGITHPAERTSSAPGAVLPRQRS